MKKIFITAGMLCAGFFFAQEGNIGINTNAPGATLDVNISPDITDATKGQGVAVPRVSKERLAQMTGDIVTSSLVYVDREKNGDTTFDDTALTATVGSVNRVEKVKGIGFYYFNGRQWVGLGDLATVVNTVIELPVPIASGSITEDIFAVIATSGGMRTVELPKPDRDGRVLSINNQSGNALTFQGAYQPVGLTRLAGGAGHLLISYKNKWYVAGGLF